MALVIVQPLFCNRHFQAHITQQQQKTGHAAGYNYNNTHNTQKKETEYSANNEQLNKIQSKWFYLLFVYVHPSFILR